MKTFWIRTLSATVYALLFVGCIYAGCLTGSQITGTIIFIGFLSFVAVGCSYEIYRMARKHRISPLKGPGYMITGLTTIILGLSMLFHNTPYEIPIYDVSFAFLRLGLLLLLTVPLCLIIQLWRKSKRPLSDVAYTFFPVLYAALPLGLMPFMNNQWNVMMMILIMVWVNDSFAYMGGSLFGRHKMWQRHSPGKTWEGTACGIVFTIAVALIAGPLFHTQLLWYDWMVLAIICGIIGTLGDLVESMMKRSFGVKDSGNIMPGHGGFLDRFDSLLTITPIAFIYLSERFLF
ncbi:MAG: phosphatidate cytidylyltransferase [Bacteroidales bacterium]|nr:phosphatidate cytidylyltransferase [Bacteroidales bacterium]